MLSVFCLLFYMYQDDEVMEEVKLVTQNLFDWVIKGTGIAIAFLFGWIAKLQWNFIKSDKHLAINTQADKARDKEIHEIKLSYNVIVSKVDQILLVVQEQKEMHNILIIRIDKLLNELSD